MAAAHIFLSIAGSQFLGNMVTRATDKLTRKIGPRVIRALRNYNLREARGSPNISEASIKEVQHARKNAVSQFRSFRKSFERSSRTLNSFITRDLELTTKLDRAAGRIFAGPNSSKLGKAFAPSFTKHMKTVIANDLATMPVTYAMYQYDKSKYPEMKDTSFMKYYMQTIPYNLGFQASSAAVRTVTKVASSRLTNKVAHSRFTAQAIESVLDIGQVAAAKVGAALSYHSTLKREMIDSTALRDFASVRGVQGIWHRLGHAHRSAASAARTPYATRVMDSDLFQRRMGEYYQQTSISQQDARRVGEEFNSMLDPDFKRSHAFGFLNKLLEPHNIRLQKEVAAPMLINRPQPNGSNQPAVITDFVRDRSRFEFVRNGIKDEKAYDFGIFNIDRLRDSVADFVEGSGFHTPFGFLKGLKITTGGFDFIRSDFKRNLSNAVVGGKARSFAVTPALAEIANNQPGISEIKETADYRKHAEGILRETFGLRSSEEAGVLLERMASSHNAKTIEQVSSTISSPFQVDLYSKRLVENAKHGSLPIEKGSFFFFNNKGYGTLITGGDTGRDYVATGLGRMTISTNENKSSIAEVMTRVLGSTKHGNEIYGLERTRKLSGHELYEQRKSMGITDEKELWGFVDTISERFDLGGGGTSVLDWIKGYYTKFKNPSYARNIFTSDVFVNEVNNLTSPTPDVSSAKWFIKTLDNVFSTSQERVSRKLFDSNTQRRRFWGVLDRQLSSFSEKVGAEFRHSEMSLNGITNISDALQRVNRYEEFANAFDSPNMVQFTGSLKKALTEKGSIKEALNTITFGDNITMFEKYESMLDHNFLIRAHQTGNPEVPATDVFFETARRLMPKSKMGDFSTYSKIISSHNKIISIRNIKGPDNAITDEYIEGLQSLGSDLDITDSTLGKRMSHLLMGKFGEFSDSVGFKRYKYIPHNTDAMFFFTDRGKMMPGLTRGKDVRGVETDYLKDSVTTGGATMMMALNTFNRAMGWLHLGMDDYRTPRDMLTNFITKRVLPIGGLIGGMDVLDNFTDNSGLFEGTPLGEGIYQVPMNVYAGVRMASAGVLDAAGVTSVAKYTEDLLPGSINSPLSGAVRGIAPFMAGAGLGYHMGGMKGGMTGGLIGGAVGIMLGGGPLGLFDSWDISQSRAEVIQEFKGEKEVSIKKGRFWEISSGNFWGNQLSYFRPHLYHLMRSDYKDSPNYKTSMFDEIASYIDPSVYSRKHYYSRPSLEHPGLLSNIPIIGPAINLGNTEAHREDVDMTQLSRDREEIRAVYAGGSGSPGEALAMASGTGPSEYLTNNFYPDPRSNSSINSRLSDTFYNFKEVAGLRGFLAETFQESLTGNKQLFADQPTIEANAIGSMGRQFWDLNLGGIAGLSEGIRRIFPRKTADIEYFNPVRNLMPNWMPGSEFYVDFHHGDPFSKIEMGEARLPGESYETVRSVAPVTPGEADLLGTTSEEAMGYYSGDIEAIIPRYKWNDKIEQRKKLLIDSLKAQGSLIREQGIVYDTSKNITAYADATYRNDDGEIVPVKFAPYLGKEGGFLAGSASSLNAYLTLSGTRKGLLIGIDETGNTTQAIIFRDSERYEREAENDLQVRMRSYQELAKRRARGEPTAPGMHYSHMDRLKILSDVAYYSNQYKNELKIVKTQIKSGILGEQEALEVEDIENKVEKLKQKFLFIEDRFGGGEALTPEAQRRRDDVDSRYNAVERTIGKLWQDITTMRNPIISKLIGNRTALQAYQDDVVYGRAFKEWSSPIESYVKPFYQQMAVSSNPIQGALSGATAGFLMGGPLGAAVGGFGGTAWSLTGAQFMDHGSYIPGDIKKQRQIMAAADIAERDRYQMLYEQTGYNEYLYRMRNTIAGAMELNQPMTSGRMISVANKPERMYIKGILDDLNTENLQEARALLPQNISALLDRNVGIRGDVRPEDYTGGYFVESGDVVNTQVPIEDIVVKTMQLEGLNAKDVGLGWQRTLRRMNTMKEVGIEAPAMYQRNLPKRKIEYTIAPAQIKKVLDGILREYNPSITVHSGDGPLEVVVEIV